MEVSPGAAIRFLMPKLPLVAKIAASHTLGLSETSRVWDLRTALIINLIRTLADNPKPRPLSVQQKLSLRDNGIKGPVWVSKVTAPKPEEDDMRHLVFNVIDQLANENETYTKVELSAVEAEWTGFRSGARKDSRIPQALSEEQRYGNLMSEVKSEVVILYFHGGAYYLMDPAFYRPSTSRLAKETGGKVLSVRYRLSPQNPFPAALLDAFCAYLYLLYPPAGSFHKPVPPSNIVFAGDSAGGNLSLVLLETILHLHQNAAPGTIPTVNFHGKQVEIPIPAAVATNSPWLDVTRSMPSLETNVKYDYLPPPSKSPPNGPPFPADKIWPTNPPRADIYCDGPALCHPLVSPLAAPASAWANSPPIYIGIGTELLEDENKVFAQRLAGVGVKVVWEQYQGMPHCFALLLDNHCGTNMYFDGWTKFIKQAVEQADGIQTKGTWITAKKLKREPVDVLKLTEHSDEFALKLMREAREKRLEGFEKAEKSLPKL